MEKTLVEVYVAYPPTSKCRELVRLINEATADLQDRVKVVVWSGKTALPPDVKEISRGFKWAIKLHITPAVIVNGDVKFGRSIPQPSELRKAILDPSSVPNLDVGLE